MSQQKKTHFEYYVEELLNVLPPLDHAKQYEVDRLVNSSHYTAPEIMSQRAYEVLLVLTPLLKGKEEECSAVFKKYFPVPVQ